MGWDVVSGDSVYDKTFEPLNGDALTAYMHRGPGKS